VEKFRPRQLSDVAAHKDIIDTSARLPPLTLTPPQASLARLWVRASTSELAAQPAHADKRPPRWPRRHCTIRTTVRAARALSPEMRGCRQQTTSSASYSGARTDEHATIPPIQRIEADAVQLRRTEWVDGRRGHGERAVSRLTQENRLPHLLLYGPPGTGKTSTVLAVARQLYGHQGYQNMTLELNASDDRGIDFVRKQIQDFASTKRIFRYDHAAGL
jgi:hypothetical protein